MPKDQGYTNDWPTIAKAVKAEAHWTCSACGAKHNPKHGYCLTVHHKDGDETNNHRSNLIALCQRCHLQRQRRLRLYGPEDHRQMRLPLGAT